jgi:hypothetical protein
VRTLKTILGKINGIVMREANSQHSGLFKLPENHNQKKKEVISEEGYKLCSHACIRNGIDMQMT